jgi:hypothetical protein
VRSRQSRADWAQPNAPRVNVWGDPINAVQPFVPESEEKDRETEAAIRAWRAKERADGPELVPLYGCKPFTPATRCQDVHHGPLPVFSRCYCEVCSHTGAAMERRIGKPTPPPTPKKPTPAKFRPKGAQACRDANSSRGKRSARSAPESST